MADVADPVTGAPWREPVRGGHPPAAAVALSGRAQLETALTGAGPEAPLNHLTGLRLTDLGDGTASFTMPLSPWWQGLTAAVELGPLVIPADAAMACAVISRLPAYCAFTSTEVALRLMRAPTGPMVTARARLLSLGAELAIAEATVADADGLVAHATSSGLLLRLGDAAPPSSGPVYPPAAGPDPWQRQPTEGEPLHELFGITVVCADEGRAELAMPASPWFCAPPPGRLQGGTIAVLAEAAQSAALIATLPAGSRPVAAEVKLNYVRPLASDDAIASCATRVVHAGRSTAMTVGEVTDARERTVAVCTGSALVERAG